MTEQPNRPKADEIDLGQVFSALGNALQKIANFFEKIFRGLFSVLLWFLLIVQRNFKVFLIVGVFSLITGLFIELYVPKNFESAMVVQPNFNSTQQLYNNIRFYNELAESEDSITLARALEISPDLASKIVNVYIDSYSDENQKVLLFDRFVRSLDSTTLKTLDYKDYIKNFNSMDAQFHRIRMICEVNDLAKQTQEAIISSVSQNAYFLRQKEINQINLDLEDEVNQQQDKQLDSLEILYKEVLIKEADKPMQGTSINFAEAGSNSNREILILQERESLKQKRVELNQKRADTESIINVISDFPSRGVQVEGFLNEPLLLCPSIGVAALLLILLLGELNRYLKQYSLNQEEITN